ncbi:MAG: toll/interleukin-1 receptor domain-containing protein, partial [Pseudonocardia sp.]
MARVFVSHSSVDDALADEVHRWLAESDNDVFLDRNLRDGIAVGERWEPRLHERLRWADAVVCVLTKAYVDSTWCTAELAIAQSRGARILPILAEPHVKHPLLSSLQHAGIEEDLVDAQTRIVEALQAVDTIGGVGWPDDRSPFPGLRSFDSNERQVFFGRSLESKQLAASLRSSARDAEAPVLLVVGPSGCGKSSLVRAGLLPLMSVEPSWWTLPPLLPGKQPVAALARELAAAARQVGLSWSVFDIRRRLNDNRLAEIADDLLLAVRGPRRENLLLGIDQFEELLTQSAASERLQFGELLQSALSGPVRAVGTLRPEFLEQLLLNPELAGLAKRVHTIQPLSRDTLRMVIEGPAQLAGIAVDDELVTQLVADTENGEALPLLAFTLSELSQGVGRGGRLLSGRYEQLGGVQGALARHADAALAEATSTTGRAPGQVIRQLLQLVTVDERGRPTRRRVRRTELAAQTALELDCFVAHRLLLTDLDDDGRAVVGVAHEALLSAWPPLAEAIDAAATALRARRVIDQAA